MSKGETHRGGCMKFAAPRQPPAPARFLNLWEAVQELESGSYLWVSPRPWRQPASPCWRLRSPGPPVPDGAPIASLTLSLYPPSSVSLSTKPLITEFIFFLKSSAILQESRNAHSFSRAGTFYLILVLLTTMHEWQNHIPKYNFLVGAEMSKREVDQSCNYSIVHTDNLKCKISLI